MVPRLRNREESFSMYGKRVDKDTVRPFMFAPIQKSGACRRGTIASFFQLTVSADDDALLDQMSHGIGDIVLKVSPCIATARTKPKYRGRVPTQSTVHERMKKGIDHQTTCVFKPRAYTACAERRIRRYAAPIVNQITTVYKSKVTGPPRTFTFRYRPLG